MEAASVMQVLHLHEYAACCCAEMGASACEDAAKALERYNHVDDMLRAECLTGAQCKLPTPRS